ncbi:MAG TPA: amino acid adenylation domain-containing protein [Luteolibacter sp.]|nr:amino acid adenylation domain-containing protein [Luteolibacter sp.]
MHPPTIVTPLSIGRIPLLEAFEKQASAAPHRTAVICGGVRLSFKQLAGRSDAIASELHKSGTGKGDFVGIGLDRGIDLIVALLGVLKAGAAYIPVDPAYPAARIAHMISSSGLKRIITSARMAGRFGTVETLLVDSLGESEAPGRYHNEPGDPIYAIFTSGSTGAAKAASVFHRGFLNLVDWYASELQLSETDVTLVISSPSFDLTQKNFFTPLITGGTLVLDHGDNYDIHRISSLIRDHAVTLVNCTPSAFYPLVDAAATDGYGSLSTLRFAVLGGEAISIPRLRPWLEHPSCSAEIVNSYGPTECTDICAFHRTHRGNLDDFDFIPTGKEIPNVTVTIRDEEMKPLPAGETGELCIEGIGVGGGYLNDPEKTAGRFVGGIYRTGDLAKRDADGVIEFRGRADHQVKVNGFRIELGEIETHLNRHPDVREAVVIAQDGRLIAHVQGTADLPSIRELLTASLPAYMIPGEFRFVETFALTPNGKIDRKALQETQTAPTSIAEPQNALETKLLAIWSGILGRTVQDPSANFFDLGGTSIHLAIAHVKLREMTGRDLPITDLFAHPSARSLAKHLSPAASSSSATQAQDRAKLQQAGFSGFRRPTRR